MSLASYRLLHPASVNRIITVDSLFVDPYPLRAEQFFIRHRNCSVIVRWKPVACRVIGITAIGDAWTSGEWVPPRSNFDLETA